MYDSRENHIGYLIQQTAHLLEQRFNAQLAGEGVTLAQARVIYLLYATNGATQSELQQDLLIKAASLTKLLDVLEQKGLVRREANAQDGRKKRIFLTEAGQRKEARLCQIREAMEARLSQFLAPPELARLVADLKRVRQTLL